MNDPLLRVIFLHGLESSPRGDKARYLAARFEALTPAMDTSDFAACVALAAESIASHEPHVVVGSSFGGAVAMAVLQQKLWRGPTLLLAPAGKKLGLDNVLPPGVPVTIVHGRHDAVVPPADSLALAATGDPVIVKLLEVDDEHRLASLIAGERLAELVHEIHTQR